MATAGILIKKQQQQQLKLKRKNAVGTARDAERENVRDWLDEIEESSVRDHVARTQAKGARSNEIQHLADVVQVFLQSVHVAKRSQSGGSKLPTSMSHLTLGTDDRENREMCQFIYEQINGDGLGGLDVEDLKRCLMRIGVTVSTKKAKLMIAEIDTDGDETVSFDEFMAHAVDGPRHADFNPLANDKTRAASAHDHEDVTLRVAAKCCAIVTSPAFDYFIVGCIVCVAVATYCEVEFFLDGGGSPEMRAVVDAVQGVALGVFILECALKMGACGPWPREYFIDADEGVFNTFDFTIVVLSIAMRIADSSTSVVAVARLLRLIKLMNRVPQLRVIVQGVVAGMSIVGPILALLGLIIFLGAMIAKFLFGENDPAHFAHIGQAALTLFQMTTLSGWGHIFHISYFGCEHYNANIYVMAGDASHEHTPTFVCRNPQPRPIAASCFFFGYTLLTAFVVLSFFVSFITSKMFESMEARKQQLRVTQAVLQESAGARRRKLLAALEGDTAPDDFFPSRVAAVLNTRAAEADEAERKRKKPPSERAQRACARVVNHPAFESFIVVAIVATAVCEVLEVEKLGDQAVLRKLGHAILSIFTFEAALKIGEQWPRPLRGYLSDAWNRFDGAVLLLGLAGLVVDLSSVTVLRCAKMLRVLRVVRRFPILRSVTQSLLAAVRDVFWVVVLILIINFIFGATGMIMFHGNDPVHFHTMRKALMSVWAIETLDGWEDLLYINMYGCDHYGYYDMYDNPSSARECDEHSPKGWWAVFYFAVVVVLGSFVLPALLVGVVSIAFFESTEKIRAEEADRAAVRAVLKGAEAWARNEVESTSIDLDEEAGRAKTSPKNGPAYAYAPPDQRTVESARAIFDALNFDIDTGSENSLASHELQPFLAWLCARTFNLDLKDFEIDRLYAILDQDKHGEASWADFLWFMLWVRHQVATGAVSLCKEAKVPVPDARGKSNGEEETKKETDIPILTAPRSAIELSSAAAPRAAPRYRPPPPPPAGAYSQPVPVEEAVFCACYDEDEKWASPDALASGAPVAPDAEELDGVWATIDEEPTNRGVYARGVEKRRSVPPIQVIF